MKHHPPPRLVRFPSAAMALSAALFSFSAVSDTVTWTGSAGDWLWGTSGNWSADAVPTAGDTAIVNAGTSANPVLVATGESADVNVLRIASEENSSGLVEVSGTLTAALGGGAALSIGHAGTGTLRIANGSVTATSNTRSTRHTVGALEGSSGTLVVEGGSFTSFNLDVGVSGTGTAVVGNGGVLQMNATGSEGNQDLSLGRNATGVGYVTINDGGLVSTIRTLHVGRSGKGTLLVNHGGNISISKSSAMASSEGSEGTIIIDGGTFSGTGSSGSTFGDAGTALVHVKSGGTFTASGSVTYGDSATGDGTLRVDEGGTYGGQNTSIYLGKNGSGSLLLRGGSLQKTGSGGASLSIRLTAAGRGIVRGWGTVTTSKNVTFQNSGLCIADGEGEARTLAMRFNDSCSFANTVENDSTNGWYAINNGLLDISMTASAPAGDEAAFTWGDANADEVLDMVNSARLTFYGITGKYGIQSVGCKIYALDRTDTHFESLPAAATKVGNWSFNITSTTYGGSCSTYDLTLRYDHVAAKGLTLALLRWNGSTWNAVEGVTWDKANHLMKASGLTPDSSTALGTFAVVGSHTATCLFLR